METLEFQATLDEHTTVQNYWLYRGEDRQDKPGYRVGDLYIDRDELGEDPPAQITVRLEWL